jgi:hypothetical protein
MLRPIVLALIPVLAACGDDASTMVSDAAVLPDSAPDASGFDTCEGSCQTTALTATFASTRVLDRAYYGLTQAATGTTLHIEAYRGGDPGCPEKTSASPDYALILGRVPVPTSAEQSTSPANILDFTQAGDLLGGPLGAAATNVVITPVAARVCTSCVGMPAPSDPDGMVALDVEITFPTGTVTGHLYATHCDSFDVIER